jgi:superfamily II DNA helicase RecQ
MQGEQKRAQIDQVIRFAAGNQCRMLSLVRHFGDYADTKASCGICDFCAPAECVAQQFRPATAAERETVLRAIRSLSHGQSKTTGRLHAELFPNAEMVRDDFEEILGAMARAALVRITEAVFEKDGKSIPYRKVSLTRDAQAVDEAYLADFVVKDGGAPAAAPLTRTRKKKAKTKVKVAVVASPQSANNPQIEDALKKWRLAEAKRLGVPAFRILSDRALRALAVNRPSTAAELLATPGIGIATVEKYGHQFYRILNG